MNRSGMDGGIRWIVNMAGKRGESDPAGARITAGSGSATSIQLGALAAGEQSLVAGPGAQDQDREGRVEQAIG